MADPGGGGPGGSGGSSGAGGGAGGGAGAGDAGEEGGGYSDADVGVGYGGSSGSTSGGHGGTGQGRQDGPGSVTEGNQFGGGQGTASEAGLMDAINSAIARGVNPYSDTFNNVIAAGMISGKFGNPASFGIGNVDMESPEVAGFMDQYGPGQNSGLAGIASFIGYNPEIGFMQNIANMAIPGRNTPLGILSAAIPGKDTVKGIVGLANTIAGRLDIGSTTNPSAPDTALSGSVVGKDSIAGSYGANSANTGIASGLKF